MPNRQAGNFARSPEMPNYLAATGEGRQNLHSNGRGEGSFQIRRMSCQSVKQHRTCLDDPVEVRIRTLVARESEGFGNGSGLDLLLCDARGGPCASPVVKGDGHRCVSLKHAFRPFLEAG